MQQLEETRSTPGSRTAAWKTILLASLLLLPRGAMAWINDPAVCTGVATTLDDESDFACASLPDGSTVVMWARVTGAPWTSDMYIQRLSATGAALWGADGMLLAGGDLIQEAAIVTTDARGNIFAAWCEQPSDGNSLRTTLRLQRLDVDGTRRWLSGGVVVSTTTDLTEVPVIKADGQGGVFVGWTDSRKKATEDSTDIYVQHLSKSGGLLWRAPGLPVNRAPGHQTLTGLDADGLGGIVVAWRAGWWSDYPTQEDTYAQRVSAAGQPVWNPAGVLVWSNQVQSYDPKIVSDGKGGAHVIWVDDSLPGIRGQYILADGMFGWGASGIAVATITGRVLDRYVLRRYPGDGFVAGWADARDGRYHSYLQRVNASGQTLWGDGGLRVAPISAGSEGLDLQITPSGESVVFYEDYPLATSSADITAAVFRPDGTRPPGWPDAGIPICTATGAQANPKAVVTAQGAIACWRDARVLLNPDVFAQRVLWSGSLGAPFGPGERRPDGQTPGGLGPRLGLGDRMGAHPRLSPPAESTPASGERIPAAGDRFSIRAVHTRPGSRWTVEFALPRAAGADVSVYDIRGRLACTPVRGSYSAGRHIVELVPLAGTSLPHGVLFARLAVGGQVQADCRLLRAP